MRNANDPSAALAQPVLDALLRADIGVLVISTDDRYVIRHCNALAQTLLAPHVGEIVGRTVLDIRMDGMSGLELFDRLLELGNRLPVIFLTGHGDVPMAVSSLKKGAFDFVEKPFYDNELVNRVLEAIALDSKRQGGGNERRFAADVEPEF